MDVERTFVVDRPIEDVFAFLADFENTESWDPGTIETTRTSGDGGLGTRYRNRSQFMGRTVELEYETIAFEPPTHVVIQGRNGRTTTADHLTFTAEGERTRIHYRAVFDFPFPLSVVVPLVFRGKLRDLADETVAQVRRSLETR